MKKFIIRKINHSNYQKLKNDEKNAILFDMFNKNHMDISFILGFELS